MKENAENRILRLIIIMAVIAVSISLSSLAALYHTSFEQQSQRLIELVSSQARLMSSIARFSTENIDPKPSNGSFSTSLQQIILAQGCRCAWRTHAAYRY